LPKLFFTFRRKEGILVREGKQSGLGGRGLGRIRIDRKALLLLIIFLAGCAPGEGKADTGEPVSQGKSREISEVQESSGESGSGEDINIVSSMEAEPDLAYEVPESVPNICVNRLGYIAESDKTAIFYGKELPKEFYVVREESGEVVFNGTLRDKGYNAEQQEYNGYGDFSEVQESGTYYIEAPVLGKSYSFMIGEDPYGEVFRKSCGRYGRSRCSMELSEAAKTIAVTLLAYELNTGVFTDDTGILESGNEIPDLLDEIRYEVEWMLKMQDGETGAVYADAADGERREAEGAFAMILAKFSYLYQEYDTDFATDCLKAADRAFMYEDLTGEENADVSPGASERDAWKFAAAAELYRASGKQSYHDRVLEYLSDGSYRDQLDIPVLSGCVTYISTRQTVDITVCEEITRELTLRADQAAKRVEGILFGGWEDGTDGNGRELLEESMYLILINHMITSKEYALMAENCLHYLMGRNGQSVSYIDNVGENNYRPEESWGVSSRPEDNGRLILLLSEVLNWQIEHGSGTE